MKHKASPDIEDRARRICEPLIAAEGMELLEVEYLREGGRWVLRLFIDKPGGVVGLEECAIGSRAVDVALDVEDFIPNEYSLEVSSPGLEKPLTRPPHFVRAKGKLVRIKTFSALFTPPRKNFVGTIVDVSAVGLTLEVEGAGRFDIAFADIAKARLELVL